jgi:hypothetical protein
MGGAFVILPLWLGARRRGLARPSAGLLFYFGALGVAFMLVEVPTIQRLTVYLGRPVYSLAAALFSLLLFSGLGSLWSNRGAQDGATVRRLRWLFPTLVGLILLQVLAGAWLLDRTIGWSLPARLVVTTLILAPISFLMGVPFPLGMRWAGEHRSGVVPWLWGINGVMSVTGSALAIALAIHIGLRLTLLVAGLLYGLAGLAMGRVVGREHAEVG